MKKGHYEAFIDNVDHIYDGDTINHVHIKLGNLEGHWVQSGETLELFPEIIVMNDALWVYTAVRLLGIDCPEFHPRHRLPSGEPRSPEDIEWEHQRATEARNVVREILQENDLKFFVGNPVEGKYAGRIVAEVWARAHKDTDMLVNVSKRLLAQGLAYEYDGGTKQIWTKPEGLI